MMVDPIEGDGTSVSGALDSQSLAALKLVSRRLEHDRTDLRHTLLDMSPNLLALDRLETRLPVHLQREWRELYGEVQSIQPQFPSHRKTSELFDQRGLGQHGHDRARRLATRIIAFTKEVEALG